MLRRWPILIVNYFYYNNNNNNNNNNNIYQMASSRNSKKRSSRRGGRSKRTEKKLKHKWHQRGCQNQTGGGSITGGWAWGPSDVHHQTATSPAGSDVAPHSINGNHYAVNTATVAPPQASNAIIERQNTQTAGRRRGRGRGRKEKAHKKYSQKKSRRVSCQRGGMAEYLPELVNASTRTTLQIPANIANALQGSATPFVSAEPTSQPIGSPISLK
jgi:hypothetical protein